MAKDSTKVDWELTPVLSKVKIGNTYYYLKDKEAREELAELEGNLGTAAYRNVAAAITDGDGKIADAATVKSYVDAQVASIDIGEVVIDSASQVAGHEGEPATPASASTYRKLYLVADAHAAAGSYIEWITIRSGAGTELSPYTYAWEKIGTTELDLAGYVPVTREIAGIDLEDDITANELKTALGLEDLAFADTASGSTTLNTIDSITMKTLTVSGSATVTTTSATATITNADYTPAGSISVTAANDGAVVTGATIAVTVKDATTASDISNLTFESYTPAGTIAAATVDGTVSAVTSVSITADENGAFQVGGSVSKPNVNLTSSTQSVVTEVATAGTAPSFTNNVIGTYTAAELQSGFYSAGTTPTFSQGSKASLTNQTTGKFVKKAQSMTVGTGDDAECLIISDVATSDTDFYADAVTDRGTFTANGDDTFTAGTATTIDTTKFSGGSWTAGTFNAGAMPTFNTGSVNNVTAAELAAAPTFTGDKYAISAPTTSALRNVVFTGTAANVKLSGAKYYKQEIDSADVTLAKANLAFNGTTVSDVKVASVAYDKADATASFSTTALPEVDALNTSAKTISITVEPDNE